MRSMIGLLTLLFCFATAQTALAIDAAQVYATKCSMCHGPKGEGTPAGPTQRGNEFVTKGKSDEIKKVILDGRSMANKKYPNIPVEMPKGLVTEAEAEALVTFLQVDLQK